MKTLTLLGAGKMGQAMLKGWLNSGIEYPITIIDPYFNCDFEDLLRSNAVLVNPKTPPPADILIIGIKPQTFREICEDLNDICKPETLIVSIMAGIGIKSLEVLGANKIFRAMPNTPGQIGAGICGVFGNALCGDKDFETVIKLLSPLGDIVKLNSETEIDIVTAVSGSGPAYVFLMAEALAKAGEKLGLSAEISMQLAKATIYGAGQLMRLSDEDPSNLRKAVTSPGGTTQAALEVLMDDASLEKMIDSAVKAAFNRAKELS